jgi:hypothetical protein
MIKLICKRVSFYSLNDELAFDEWINKIKCIKKFEGIGDEMHLYVHKSYISQTCLREILSLFYRYHIEMRQLQQLATSKNREWFENKHKYWYKSVFGEVKKPKVSKDPSKAGTSGVIEAINKVREER